MYDKTMNAEPKLTDPYGFRLGGAASNTDVTECTQLEVVVSRIDRQAARADDIEKELYSLIGRLQGEQPDGEDCAAGPNTRLGLIGSAMSGLDHAESKLANCSMLLLTLRGLV